MGEKNFEPRKQILSRTEAISRLETKPLIKTKNTEMWLRDFLPFEQYLEEQFFLANAI